MNLKTSVSVLAAVALINMPLLCAAEGVSQLPAGMYVTTLSPNITANAAKQIEAGLKKLPELKIVKVQDEDSSVRFTVKKNKQIGVEKLTEVVQDAAPGTTLSEPLKEPASSLDKTKVGPKTQERQTPPEPGTLPR